MNTKLYFRYVDKSDADFFMYCFDSSLDSSHLKLKLGDYLSYYYIQSILEFPSIQVHTM